MFYFNRLIAVLVSSVVRIYTWHYYRAYVDIQALQVSPLAGRVFFKGVRYHGRNESILIQDGHITWRYWLRRVQDLERKKLPDDGYHEFSRVASGCGDNNPEGRAPEVECAGDQRIGRLPCRALLKARGLQWFIYNRSPAYDAILQGMLDVDGLSQNGSNAPKSPRTKPESSGRSSRSSVGKAGISRQRYPKDDGDFAANVVTNEEELDVAAAKTITGQSFGPTDRQTRTLPSFMNFLPVGFECGKAAIVMGNQNTRSILVAKVDSASGQYTARPSRPVDLYKQVIEFDFAHPTIHFKHNREYKNTSFNEGARLCSSKIYHPASKQSWYDKLSHGQRLGHPSHFWKGFLPYYRASVESLSRPHPTSSGNSGMVPDEVGAYGRTKWLGLTRYLDDDEDMLQQNGWSSVEYAQLPNIVDCSAISMSFSWDIPGVVLDTPPNTRGTVPSYEAEINGDISPDWTIELKVGGGIINYGPWADRQRMDLQSVFFPSLYKSAIPAKKLAVGATRICTELKVILILEDQLTLRIPTREESKDWKWKGETPLPAAVDPKQRKRHHIKGKKHADATQGPGARPFGWVDVKVLADSTIKYTMGLVAIAEGYRNRVEVDLSGLEMFSSVNHALFWRSQSQIISCDLSNPLGWNSLHRWRIDICDQGLELFLLRDHVFLMTNLISDWTSGTPGAFQTFVPFEYSLNLRFKDFRLYVNGNDSNIINNPIDLNENTFVVVWGQELIADMLIPMRNFRPSRRNVEFNLEARDGGFELFMPAWNTQHTFLESANVAGLNELRIRGFYESFTKASPTLTDTLLMNVYGLSPRVQLYGFLIRYLINIKDNYFGEDMHFRTLEEYQRQLGSAQGADGEDLELEHHKRPSNDLDVILTLNIDDSSALLPSNLYSAENNITLEVQSIMAEVRITNYYMDLAISSSPVSVSRASRSKQRDDIPEKTSQTQLFIDGLQVIGHRLFGLPPSEPTYVCNWDFEIGDISGECSIEFIKGLILALRCFALSFSDDENALPPIRHATIHDVTFLRANVRSVLIALRFEQAALLLSAHGFKVNWNDWVGPLFSDRLYILVPNLTFIIIDGLASSGPKQDQSTAVGTHAFFKTTIEFYKVTRKVGFWNNRLLQQNHIALHDSRTCRVPWLLQSIDTGPPLSIPKKVRAPAMPFPSMPAPISERDVLSRNPSIHHLRSTKYRKSPSLVSASPSSSIKYQVSHSLGCDHPNQSFQNELHETELGSRRPLFEIPSGASRSHIENKAGGEDIRMSPDQPSLAFSSKYKKPHFPLLAFMPDTSEVPIVPEDLPDDDVSMDDDVLKQLKAQVPHHNDEQISFLIRFNRGIQALCKPRALVLVAFLQERLQINDAISLLDNVHVDVLKDVLAVEEKRKRGPTNMEMKIFAPFLCARFINYLDLSSVLVARQERYDLFIDNIALTTRSMETAASEEQQPISKQFSLHILVDQIDCSARECTSDSEADQAVISLRLDEPVLWLFQDLKTSAEMQFNVLEISSASRKVTHIFSLIRQTVLMSEDLARRFSRITQQQRSRLRLLILLLAKEGEAVPDPPFLSGASSVVRSTTNHLRASDSWRMISRLHYVQSCLPEYIRDRVHAQCVHKLALCPKDAGDRVTAFFERWRTWDLANIRSSILMQRVYGGLLGTSSQSINRTKPLQASVRGRQFRVLVDPGPSQNEMAMDKCLLGICLNQIAREGSSLSRKLPLNTIQAHCVKFAVRLSWSLGDLLEDIVQMIRSMPVLGKGRPDAVTAAHSARAKLCLHVLLSSDMSILNINTINLKAISVSQGLKVSILCFKAKDALPYRSCGIVVNADAIRFEVHGQAAMLTVYDLHKPRIFGSQELRRRGEAKKPWKVVGSGHKVSFQIVAQPLELAEVADNFLQVELTHLMRWIKTLSAAKAPPPSSKSAQNTKGLLRAHVALILDSYNISSALLPSLTYEIRGGGVRTLVVSGVSQQKSINVNMDMKEHAHIFTSDANDDAIELSSLQLPPISGHLELDFAPERRMVSFQILVEYIILSASSIHVILDAVNRPAFVNLARDVHQEILLMEQHVGIIFGTRESEQHSDSASSTPFLYDANATIAGFKVNASTPGSYSFGRATDMEIDLGRIHMQATNINIEDGDILGISELRMQLNAIKIDMRQRNDLESRSCGNLVLGLVLTRTSKTDDAGILVRTFLAESRKLDVNIYPESALAVVATLAHLQDSLKNIDLSSEVKGLRKLGRERLRREGLVPPSFDTQQTGTSRTPIAEFSPMYSLVMLNIRLAWKIGDSVPVSPAREPEDLILSFKKIDLATKRDNAARLMIQDFQLQMAPASLAIGSRSLNSALLPEVVFNVAYKSTNWDRRLAFQAVAKSLDLQLTSQFILPANDLRRSIAFGFQQSRAASASRKLSTPVANAPKKNLLGNKKLVSLLVYVDFGGAVVNIQGRSAIDSRSIALNVPQNGRLPQHGRYSKFVSQDANEINATLRAPGVALKIEYRDPSVEAQSLNAEVKVSASSNVLYPVVVPLVLEISSSIKEVVGNSDDPHEGGQMQQPKLPQSKLFEDERLRTADPSAVLGNCTLNLGLRICRQDFSLSCQPIARVAARARFKDIYITVNTVQSSQHCKFFTVAAAFTGLQMSVQHVYSRESTGSFEVDSIVVSFMNSRHISTTSGISAILKISPMKALVNAKQLQDFLLFREIWIPLEVRQGYTARKPVVNSEPQTFIVQRYQQIAATGVFPWNATVSIAELDIQLDLGQSLGKSAFKVSTFWVSSTKSSDWRQNLSLGFEQVTTECSGRMSGLIELQNFKVRTSIQWPVADNARNQTPLVQASLGLDHLRVKADFDYQAFLVADISKFEFLMYNVRDLERASRDRLVGFLEGDIVQVFCTTTSASQAYALYQAFQRLIEEKRKAYEASLTDIEKFSHRNLSINSITTAQPSSPQLPPSPKVETSGAPLRLQTDVVVTLKAVNLGAFPSTFIDNLIFKMEALETSARFAVILEGDRIHSTLGMTLGQLRIALSSVDGATAPKTLEEVSIAKVVAAASGSRGGTILKVPQLIANMQTWQGFDSTQIDYIFRSSFQGRVDVGWNFSRISYIRGMYANHARTLATRLGKALPPSAVQITGFGEQEGNEKEADGGREKITAVVNVPQSKYQYTALEPTIIETPQLRDMGEATPPLEWIGLQRERLPNLTHQIVIVTLLEVAKEVDDAYTKILGSS